MKRPSTATITAWLAVILMCAYWPIACDRAIWEATHYELMLEGYGVPLAFPVRFLVSHHVALFRILFGLSAVLVLAKEFFVRDKRLCLVLTLAAACIVFLLADAVSATLTYTLQRFVSGLA